MPVKMKSKIVNLLCVHRISGIYHAKCFYLFLYFEFYILIIKLLNSGGTKTLNMKAFESCSFTGTHILSSVSAKS